MERPRRMPFGYESKNSKEKKEENDIDPFGVDTNDLMNENEGELIQKGGVESWLDDVDNLPLPSRRNNKETNIDTNNIIKHPDRSNSNKNIEQEYEFSKNKIKKLESEIEKIKKGDSYNKNDVLKLINHINSNSLGLGKKIGQGGFSEIYESKWMGIPVAVKVIFDPKITQTLIDEFNNELEKLFILRHPNIIQLYGKVEKEKSQKLTCVMELASNGSMFDYLHKNQKYKNNVLIEFKKKIIKQLMSTIQYIHSRGYVHRDLKTQNMLLDKNLDLKLCDFGLTKKNNELNSGSGQYAGTPCYMAPELFDKKFYDEKIDIFAFGTIVWEIYTQKIPYSNCDVSEIRQKVTKGDELQCSSSVPNEIAELIRKCRKVNPSERPTMEQIQNMSLF